MEVRTYDERVEVGFGEKGVAYWKAVSGISKIVNEWKEYAPD